MESPHTHTLPKKERLNSRILIEKLFAGGSKSFPAFPLRVVYIPVEGNHLPPVSLLISVPKKRFKRAVKRNRVKRQIREAFRKNKQILTEPLANTDTKLAIAFILAFSSSVQRNFMMYLRPPSVEAAFFLGCVATGVGRGMGGFAPVPASRL